MLTSFGCEQMVWAMQSDSKRAPMPTIFPSFSRRIISAEIILGGAGLRLLSFLRFPSRPGPQWRRWR
jgi:hypothetical protein